MCVNMNILELSGQVRSLSRRANISTSIILLLDKSDFPRQLFKKWLVGRELTELVILLTNIMWALRIFKHDNYCLKEVDFLELNVVHGLFPRQFSTQKKT